MATVPPPPAARSGGKIVRPRRTAAPRTPYERPPPPSLPNSEDHENPNWLSRLIFSPTRMIASGAGKVLSTVFASDSPSSSSCDEDSPSEDEMNDDNDASFQGADGMEKTFDKIDSSSKESQPVDWNFETKRVIERLLIQETFSREECDRLTDIIKSRVVDSTTQGTVEGASLTVGNDVYTDLRRTAILEAKNCLEEKNLGSSSKPELDYGTCTLNTAMLPHDTEDQGGSPVDLAKSYMRTRPPWSSPSISPIEFKSPSPKGIQSFQEGTPYFSGTSASLSKLNRDSTATGSWNIMEELRRVRLKATEEMLKTPSSSRIDWSALTSSHRKSPKPLTVGKMEAVLEDKSLTSTQDAPPNLNGEATTNGLADGQQNEAERLPPATSLPQDQDMVDISIIEGPSGTVGSGQRFEILEGLKAASQSYAGGIADGYKVVDGTNQASGFMVGETLHDAIPDSRPHQNNCSASKDAIKDIAGRGDAVTANGFPSSASSLSAGQERVEHSTSSDEERDPAGSGHERMNSTQAGGTCNLLSEASIEVPVLEEHDTIGTASQDSSSMNHKEPSQDLTRSRSRSKPAGKTGGKLEQQERKVSRYNRRVRGRGK